MAVGIFADHLTALGFAAASDAFALVVENFVVAVALEDLFVVSLGADFMHGTGFDQLIRVVGDPGANFSGRAAAANAQSVSTRPHIRTALAFEICECTRSTIGPSALWI
jgi:hypothetical protein